MFSLAIGEMSLISFSFLNQQWVRSTVLRLMNAKNENREKQNISMNKN